MMLKCMLIGVILGFLLWSGWGVVHLQAEPPKAQLLLVDETRTLQASLLVQILARTPKETGLFDVQAKLADVRSSFDNPLGHNPTEKRYELILIIPRGLENGSLRQVWIVTRPISHSTPVKVLASIQMIKTLIEQGSGGHLQAMGVMDDMIPALFERNGWLQ